MDNLELQRRIDVLERSLENLRQEFYRNNFTSHQDFNKYSNFTDRLKVPHYTSLPSTCQIGEIGEYSGKLYICSASNTWTVCGTQT